MTWAERARGVTAFAIVVFTALVTVSSIYIDFASPRPTAVGVPELDPGVARRLYVLVWGYHSSIILEQPDGWRLGPAGNEAAPFVEYGWGDRSFYMESRFDLPSLFASACLPTESVVYVRGHDRPPDEIVVGGDIYVRTCTAEEIQRVVAVLERQMARGASGERPPVLPATQEYEGRFYPGRELYVVWMNCNEWTVRMLAEAGLARSSRYVWFTHDVGWRLSGFRLVEERLSS